MALSNQQAQYVSQVSRQTGLDPRVVIYLLLSGGLPATVPAAVQRSQQLGLTGLQGKTPGEQLSVFAHATGQAVRSLIVGLEQIFGAGAAGSSYMGPGTALAVASTVGTGSAADAGSFSATDVPGAVGSAGAAIGGVEAGIVGGLTGWVGQLTRWITGYAIRVGEVVGGFLLVLAGLYLLARQVGFASSAPPGGAQLVEAVS